MKLRYLAMLSFCVLLTACSKINQENYSKLSAGMTKAEVEQLLGSPTDCSRIGDVELHLGRSEELYQRAIRGR